MRIGEPRFQFFRAGAQGLRGKLRGSAHFRERGILGDEADFVHADSRGPLERALDLSSDFGRLGLAGGEAARQPLEVVLGDFAAEEEAGDTGRTQELREAALGLRVADGHAVHQELVTDRAEQQARKWRQWASRRVQFGPRGLELLIGAGWSNP